MTDTARGSHKLLSELIKKGAAATPEEVKAAVSIPAASSDIKLLRWLIRGTPAYWEIETVFQLQPSQLGDIVNRFSATAGIRDINILINGTPKPDIAQIGAVIAHSDLKAI